MTDYVHNGASPDMMVERASSPASINFTLQRQVDGSYMVAFAGNYDESESETD